MSLTSFQKFESLIGRLVLSLFFTAFLFLLIDALYGYSSLKIAKNKAAYGAFSPRAYSGFGFDTNPATNGNRTYNELGFIGSAPTIIKRSEEYRIFVLGGSTVASSNPPVDRAIENFLKDEGFTNVRAYNFGLSASVLKMDLSRLIFEISDYKPDLVIFYGGGNDIILPAQSDPRPGVPPNYLVTEGNPILAASNRTLKFSTLLNLGLLKSNLIYSRLYEPVIDNILQLEKRRKEVQWDTPAWRQSVAKNLVSSIDLVLKVTPSIGAKPLFVLQPLMHLKKNLSKEEQSRFYSEIYDLAKIATEAAIDYSKNFP